nr:hypothetical protein [Tanacetum cinerariifolium]
MDPDEFKALQSPEQAPPSPDYVPGLEYPLYVAPSNNEIPEDLEEDPADYLVDRGDYEEEESSYDDDDEEEDEASEEDEDEEEHMAPAVITEISTQANKAQSPRLPVPVHVDPYEAIRQAYLFDTDTESEPFEDPVETKTPESPHTVASPTLLPDSTPPTHHVEESEASNTSDVRSTPSDFTAPLSLDHPITHTSPTLVLFLHWTARMAMRVPPAMSPDLSTSIAEGAAMSDSAFHKRFRSSYESSPSSSPDLLSRKHSLGTYELVEDYKEEDEEEQEDKEEEDNKDEGPAAGDVGLATGDEGPDMRVESLGLGKDEAVPEGQHRAAPVVETTVGEPQGLGYGALRRREIV